MSKHKIWVVDDDHAIRWVLEKTLTQADYNVCCFEDATTALTLLQEDQTQDHLTLPDVILSDIRMPQLDGLSFLSHVQRLFPALPVIIMTAHSDLESAVSSYQTGAFEYLPKPFDLDEVLNLVHRAIEHHQKQRGEHSEQSDQIPSSNSTEMIGESPAMQEVFRAIGRLSQSHITVLINGESGTGKELVAHALHKHSPRKKQPFIALNMAAIPKDLIETELFGHEKGAFTGANSQRQGRFEQANGGTLFLDEIGDMPFETQTRLLRVLSDGEFYRVGGHTPVKVNVRIVAATHQHLEKLVQEGRFREDLFHRLNVIRIQIPRLADRREDIPMLAIHFLHRIAQELNVSPKVLHPDTIAYMQRLPWQGNVRQLENTCRWLTVMITGENIYPEDLPQELRLQDIETTPQVISKPKPSISSPTPKETDPSTVSSHITSTDPIIEWQQMLAEWANQQLQQGQTSLLDVANPIFERTLLQVALHYSHGHKQQAAELLGWGRNTLTRKLKELDLYQE